MYHVSTKALKQAVGRNIDIFPDSFMIELTPDEFDNLRSQNVTSSWGGNQLYHFLFQASHDLHKSLNIMNTPDVILKATAVVVHQDDTVDEDF